MARETSIPQLREIAEHATAELCKLEGEVGDLNDKIAGLIQELQRLTDEREDARNEARKAAEAEDKAWQAVTNAENEAYDAYTEATLDY